MDIQADRALSNGAVATSVPHGTFGPSRVTPDDPRYPALTVGHNNRFHSRPDYVEVVGSTEQVVAAVQEAVDTGRRISVVCGGHCFADFVHNPEVQVVIDMSGMNEVGYDPDRRAFFVGGGTQLLRLYEDLYKGWGVALPGGLCHSVGIGGHATGGGYGFLSRQHGIVADYLEAVEVVVVDADGRARAVIAGRNPSDPNHDLWWAHTGGGGGNFGVVTRFWFRSPDATGSRPEDQLLKPPGEVLVSAMSLPWSDVDEDEFVRLVDNYGAWHRKHAAADDPYAALCGFVLLNHRSHGDIALLAQVDATLPNAREILDTYIDELLDGVTGQTKPMTVASGEHAAHPDLYTPGEIPWLTSVKLLGTNNPTLTNPTLRSALKSAYNRTGYTAEQAHLMYRELNRTDFQNPAAVISLVGFGGGRINAVPTDATAVAHRDSAFVTLFQTLWNDPAADEANLGWLRELYEGLFSATGGYPVPDERTGGCYINTPDPDITDPARNRSGVPWQTLYYGANYPRLQRVKAAYDPLNVFRHAQSVTAAE